MKLYCVTIGVLTNMTGNLKWMIKKQSSLAKLIELILELNCINFGCTDTLRAISINALREFFRMT